MALVPYTITALAESDAQGTDGKNIVAGAVCSMYSQPSDSVVTLYDDAAGSNGSTSKVTGANGQVVVYVVPGSYRVSVNAVDSYALVGSDVPIDVDTFANLAASSPVQDGQRFICQERANANYILQPSGYTALSGDVTFANGRVGALQIDGAALVSYFDSVQDAVTRMQGGEIYWPDGLYLSGNIAGFHNVRHRGKGRISVNGDTFYVEPSSNVSTVIYISATGNDTNIGTSSLYPFATIQAAFDAAVNYGPNLAGFWTFQIAAGSYAQATWNENLASDETILISGPNVENGTPTAIIDGDLTSNTGNGLQVGRFGAFQIKDIKSIGFNSGTGAAGFNCPGHSRTVFENAHAQDCFMGAEIRYNAEAQFGPYGTFDSNTYGIRFLHSSTGFIGRGASNLSEGLTFTSNTTSAVRLQEECTSHVDYCTLDNNNRGVDVTEQSRASINDCDFKSNTTAILVRGNSTIFNSSNIFNEGTVNANNIDIDKRSSSYTQTSIEYDSELVADTDFSAGTSTGTAEVDVSTYSLEANTFSKRNKSMSLFLSGFFGGAGNKTFRVYLDGQLAGSVTSSTSSTKTFRAEFDIFCVNKTDQVGSAILTESNENAKVNSTSSVGADMSTSGTKELKITFQGTDAASYANIKCVKLSLVG